MALDAARRRENRRRPNVDLGFRRLRPRDDTAYLTENPEMAARLQRAVDDSIAGRTHEFTLEELHARWPHAREA